MPSEKDKIWEFDQYTKSDKVLFIIYVDIESLIRKIDWFANNPENSSVTKIDEHTPFGYSMSTIWAFNNIEKKHTLYCGKDCIKKFCASLKEHAMNVIAFEKNVTVSKRIKITLRCKSMLYLWNINLKKALVKHKLSESWKSLSLYR